MSFVGKYRETSSENLKEFLEAYGIDDGKVQKILSSSFAIEISQDGDEWTLVRTSDFNRHESKFKLGEEYEEATMDGSIMKARVTKEADDKMVHVMVGEGKDVVMETVLTDTGLEVTCTCNGVTCKRYYERI